MARRLATACREQTARKAEGGFTLIEMLVVIVIFGVLGGLVLQLTLSALHTSQVTQSRDIGVSQAQFAVERLAKDLRAADPLVSADANDLTLMVYRQGACEVHRWYLGTNSQLLEDLQRYPASSSCGNASGTLSATSTAPVTGQLANGVGAPLFSFARWDDTANPPDLLQMTTPVASANVPLVQRVVVVVNVTQPGGHAPVIVQTAVDLRNVVQNS